MRRWRIGPVLISLCTLLAVISGGLVFFQDFTQGLFGNDWSPLVIAGLFTYLLSRILLLCAAALLFRLMRASFYLFAIGFGVDTILFLVLTLGIPLAKLIDFWTIFNWAVEIGILAYTYRLMKKEVLT